MGQSGAQWGAVGAVGRSGAKWVPPRSKGEHTSFSASDMSQYAFGAGGSVLASLLATSLLMAAAEPPLPPPPPLWPLAAAPFIPGLARAPALAPTQASEPALDSPAGALPLLPPPPPHSLAWGSLDAFAVSAGAAAGVASGAGAPPTGLGRKSIRKATAGGGGGAGASRKRHGSCRSAHALAAVALPSRHPSRASRASRASRSGSHGGSRRRGGGAMDSSSPSLESAHARPLPLRRGSGIPSGSPE